jgi:HAD superfamily hydrolase (TIGR01458 family)
MKAILFDLDGVIYQGGQAIAGAGDTLEWTRASGIPHRFLTNTSSKPRTAICDKLARMGIAVEAEQIHSPPVAAARWLQQSDQGAIALFVPQATREEFQGLQIWDGDPQNRVSAVVLGDLGEQWTFTRLNEAFRCLMQQPAPALVALGMTRYWKAPKGLQLDVGPFVMALAYATGIEPVVIGKPAKDFFQTATAGMAVKPSEVLMIGDDIRGDVGGAQAAGMCGLLVRTGKYQPTDLNGDIRPDAILDSIADLPRWWSALPE